MILFFFFFIWVHFYYTILVCDCLISWRLMLKPILVMKGIYLLYFGEANVTPLINGIRLSNRDFRLITDV